MQAYVSREPIGEPCGQASEDGEPQISPKGSVMAFDRDTLAYWEQAKRSALDNVAENPQVVVYYAHTADRVRCRFHGKPASESVVEEYFTAAHRSFKKGEILE